MTLKVVSKMNYCASIVLFGEEQQQHQGALDKTMALKKHGLSRFCLCICECPSMRCFMAEIEGVQIKQDTNPKAVNI